MIHNEDANAVAGTLFYMMIAVCFFAFLFMLGSLGNAMYVPKQGDIVQCNNIHTVSEKHIVLDDFGLYDCSVAFTDGAKYGIDCSEYNNFPPSGKKILPHVISARMRSGITLDSWFVVDATNTNVENACIITSGEPVVEKKDCLSEKPHGWSDPAYNTIKKQFLGREVACFINQTVGVPLTS